MRLAIDGTEKCSSSATVRIGDFLRFLTPVFLIASFLHCCRGRASVRREDASKRRRQVTAVRRYFANPKRGKLRRRESSNLLVLGVEIELNLDVIGIAQEDLAAGAVGDLVDAIFDSLAGKPLLHRLEAAAAEGDVIDDARIGALFAVGLRNVIEVQNGMAGAIEPRPGEIKRRPRPVLEPQHVLVKFYGLPELAGRDVVVVEQANIDVHGLLPKRS